MHKVEEEYANCPPGFIEITMDELELCNNKNLDYTKGGDPLGNFNRVAAIFSMYPNLKPSDPVVVSLLYMFKQLDAAMWMLNQDYEGKIEGFDERLRDSHIYIKIGRLLHGLYKNENK